MQTELNNKYKVLQQYIENLRTAGRLTAAVKTSADKALDIRQNHEHVVYLAGALTGVDEATKQRYGTVSAMIGAHTKPGARFMGYAPHLHGTDPIKHPDVTPREVRDIDYMFAVKVADSHINFLHPLAHGNAIEEGWAEEAGLPATYVSPSDLRLSRLTLGMLNVSGIIKYEDFESEALPQLQKHLDEIEKALLRS